MIRVILNNVELQTNIIRMPGGELHCSIANSFIFGNIRKKLCFDIVMKFGKNERHSLCDLLVVTDAIKNIAFQYDTKCSINLYIPYFPGARQDRISNTGEPFTLKVYTDLINSQNYDNVYITDPHSIVTTALVNNCKILPVDKIIEEIICEYNIDTIVIPDEGSSKKTFSSYCLDTNQLSYLKFVQCLKTRCTTTGKLGGFRILQDIPDSANVLICDDIIDGGGTFLGLAKEIRKHSSCNLSLYGTHGIFSKGIEELSKDFTNIFTTDSFINGIDESKVIVYNVC